MRADVLMLSFAFIAFACSSGSGASHFMQGGGGMEASGAGAGANGGANAGANASGDGSSGLGGGFTTSVTGAGNSTGSGVSNACSAAAELVYVLSTDTTGTENVIWSFDPPSRKFVKLFTLDCPTPDDGNTWAANSMAVDRNVVAWVNYVGSSGGSDRAGLVFKVDINAHTCAPTPAVTVSDASFYRIGMGFATDTANGTSETLYVAGTPGTGSSAAGLGKIDTTTGSLTRIAQFGSDDALSGQNAELTGTGDARLFGYFTTRPYVRVAEIDKGTAAILSDDELTGIAPPRAWAFSFWGGSFYLYTSPDVATNSTVVRYDPATHNVDPAYTTAPAAIVGAGVSTCAPVKPPT